MLFLSVEPREERGKKTQVLREKNILPGIVYGKEIGNLLIEVPYLDFKKIYNQAGESTVINLKISDTKRREFPVLIREVQREPVSLKIIHVDFYQIPMDKEIEISIPFVFKGDAPAEKELGGILIKNIHEVRIKTLPKNLVSLIEVDLSSLKNFEDKIKIKDLKFPSGIKPLIPGDEIVVLARKFEEEKIEETRAEMKLEEIEVIKKEKKEEAEVEEEKEKKENKKEEKPKSKGAK